MNNKNKYPTPAYKILDPDPDMQAVPAALMRALKRAHRIAHQTGTPVLAYSDGEFKEIPPDPDLYQDQTN